MELTNADPRASRLPVAPETFELVKGKYRLLRLLGDGGMGSVYEALHEGLGVRVALKFLHPRLCRWPGLVQRFLDEARLAARIRSPHVVQVLDVDESEAGLAFIVLELVSGPTLRQLVVGRRLSEAEAGSFAVQLCDGLEAVHEAGIVHRDLKPENVMVTRGQGGEPLLKLLDFGIAMPDVAAEGPTDAAGRPARAGWSERGSLPGALLGTPGYMAPEQAAMASAVDSRADLFSLGVLLHEMLTGRLPGEGAAIAEGCEGISTELARVITRAAAPSPGARYASASELRGAIVELALAGKGTMPAAADRVSGASPVDPVCRTSIEEPWFCGDPSPPSPDARAMVLSVPGGERKALEAPVRPSRRMGPAVALALTIGMALGGGVALLISRGSSAGGRAPELASAAMRAAPLTAMEPDPAPEVRAPEVAPIEALAAAHQESAPEPTPANVRVTSRPGAAPPSAGQPRPSLARPAVPAAAEPSRPLAEPAARLPAQSVGEIGPLPNPWPGSRRRHPTARAANRDPRDDAPPEIVIFVPIERSRSAPWPSRAIQVIR